MNPKTDFYFNKNNKWQEEINKLRMILLDCELTEELKWGVPCYTYKKSNIVLIHVFKEYCALLFFKGVLFTDLKQIVKLERTIKTYVYEAKEIETAGLKVPMKKTKEYDIPEEFQIKLKKSSALKEAFYALTPGRQRGYLLYFSSAKLAKTREDRIEKYSKQILAGKGMED